MHCAVSFEEYVESFDFINTQVAFGGYNEEESLYQRHCFKDEKNGGRICISVLDLWIKAGTPVLSALRRNSSPSLGFWVMAPTIILKHSLKSQVFYTLYGHL
jgi:hypothetical protein